MEVNSSESESKVFGTRSPLVSSPPWVDMRRGDEGEVSLRRRIMADSETVPADSADLREMDRHHVEETCVDQETTPQDVVAALEFDLRYNVGDGPTPRPATRRLVLVPVSRASPQSRNEEGAPERDSTLQSTVAVQDLSSHEEQSSHSLLGNRFAALMDEAEERPAEDGEGGPEFLLVDDVPVSQTETETVGGQLDVEGPVESSWSEPEPIQEADPARMSGAFRDALRGLDQIDVVHFFSVRAVVMKSPPKFVRGAYNAAMRIALQEIEAGSNPRTKRGRAEDGNYSFFCPGCSFFGLIEEASSQSNGCSTDSCSSRECHGQSC